MKREVWVIIPAHNEEQYISRVLKKVRKYTDNIIVVDDGSTDATISACRKNKVLVVGHETNLGKGAAMKTGCEYAFTKKHAKAVVFMDADDQHNPKDLVSFFQEIDQGADVVFGVRGLTVNMPLLRFIGNKFASILVNFLFSVYIPDIPSGYKALTRKAYEAVSWNSIGYEVEMEIAARVAKNKLAYSMVEIESIYHDKDKGVTLFDAIHITSCVIRWKIGL